MTPSLDGLRQRPFAYADIFRHPPTGGTAWGTAGGHVRADLDPAVATVCKNESNCTVFLGDGTWLMTWGQGSHEGHPDQRLVCATSTDMGRTWSTPATVQASDPTREEKVAYGIPFVVPAVAAVPDTGRATAAAAAAAIDGTAESAATAADTTATVEGAAREGESPRAPPERVYLFFFVTRNTEGPH